ncbi:hypothetical protein R0H17_25575 [Phytobacter diazotrophicus]|uniref:hypothetical protein n=1 Tax=Phytobacter diazotrophicus TaxID=395631 RepID=UPI00293555D2|nr:hypothetical protein [Phytobacter diazotrophicus]MDV2904995.1 hypothetical protein [Phytobacter diazotrophicus]
MAGIHLHPHDILDEGMENILQRIDGMQNVEHLFVELNTIFERNPYPVGVLPHNPVHESVMGNGMLHVNIDNPDTRLQQKIDPGVLAGNDPLRRVQQATEGTRYKVIPWVNILNGDFSGDIANNQVVDYRGRVIKYWLCPNAPDVADYWQKTFSRIKSLYGYDTFLIDRIRFPDWAGKEVNPAGLFTCFCPHCQQAMKAQDLAPEVVKDELDKIAAALAEGDFAYPVEAFRDNPIIARWVAFRQQSVTGLVERILKNAKENIGDIHFWLDLWPPAYSWILGQDYRELTRLSGTLKHFPYHKLGGGADVQGLVNFFASDEAAHEPAFEAFKKLFNLPYALSYEDFKASGFPISFVKEQNDRVRQLSQEGTFIFSGIQMWNLPPEQLLEAVRAAEASACDDLLYYCYGWADQALFDAIGEHELRKEAQ